MLQQLAPARAGSDRAAPTGASASGAYKVDISRGERIGRVSSEWFSRPDDERYLSLNALYEAVRARADRATARTVEIQHYGPPGLPDDALLDHVRTSYDLVASKLTRGVRSALQLS